jgi:hypothetical protein
MSKEANFFMGFVLGQIVSYMIWFVLIPAIP